MMDERFKGRSIDSLLSENQAIANELRERFREINRVPGVLHAYVSASGYADIVNARWIEPEDAATVSGLIMGTGSPVVSA